MSHVARRYADVLSCLVNEPDTAEVLRYMAMHDTVRTALHVALDEGADIARTVTDRVIDMTTTLAVEADATAIERRANDTSAVRALIESYRGEH